jgi:hypothetical protein
MISKSLSFPVQASIAFVSTIALNLTSSVNAAAAIAPARQFLFFGPVGRERTLLKF